MEFITHYALFALESITMVICILLVIGGILLMGRKPKPHLNITSLNDDHALINAQMQKTILNQKPQKKKKNKSIQPSLYVIDFHGDIKASQVDQFRDEISAILSIATPQDEVVVRIESPGGSVNGYGLAAAQLQRIRDKQIPLTACIDKVAASGGYLMACVANHIVAAPFAIIGSIGVVAQFPNVYRLLKKNNIDVELVTAGEYKRTLTVFGENTDKARQKFQTDLEAIHVAFQNYVLKNRPQLDMTKIATGEHWLATDAFDLRLVDSLKTSDDYLTEKMAAFKVYQITIHAKKSLVSTLLKPAMRLLHPFG